jgi:hypothetical protein
LTIYCDGELFKQCIFFQKRTVRVYNAQHINRDATPLSSAGDGGVSGAEADGKKVGRFGRSTDSLPVLVLHICTSIIKADSFVSRPNSATFANGIVRLKAVYVVVLNTAYSPTK